MVELSYPVLDEYSDPKLDSINALYMGEACPSVSKSERILSANPSNVSYCDMIKLWLDRIVRLWVVYRFRE